MSKYPKSWPVGGHAEAEAKVRQLQKIGTKWLRASGPGWVAEKQGRLSNIKFEDDPGFILIQFEALTKYKAPPPWAYAYVVVVGNDLPSPVANYVGIIYRVRYSNTTFFEATQVADEDASAFYRDVTTPNSCYIKRADTAGNISFEYIGPIQNFPGIPSIEARPDSVNGGFSWYSTATEAWIGRLFLEPALTGSDFTPTRHTVFIDPKTLGLIKYETTYAGEVALALRRDIAVADKNKNIYFARYTTNYATDTEACQLIPKAGYPLYAKDFNLYEARSPAGWLYPLSPWHLFISKTGFISTRRNDSAVTRAKIVLGKGLRSGAVTIKSQFQHESESNPESSALSWDISTVDVFDRSILAADINASFVLYNMAGEKRFEFQYPLGNSYAIPVGMPRSAALWKNKIAVFTYRDYGNGAYNWTLCGWDISEAKAEWEPGDLAPPLAPDFEFVAQTPTSPFVTIGVALRNNRIFQFAIENWSDGDVLAGTANVNRPVVFVYKWGGELIKKIDLFTELELENVGYVDAFLSDPAHSIYASPF